MQNLLAIVIPYYKPDFFEETLKSVASQTDKRFTLYIGNDASPDDPFPLIEKYFPDGNYHYFDYKENLGGKNLAMQWERILENVKEEWFQILGDDDVISENFVEEFYKNGDKLSKVNFIKSKSVITDENGIVFYAKSETIKSGYYSVFDFFIKKLQGKINSSLSEHIFRNSAFQKYRFKKYPLAWHSDDFFLLSLSAEKPEFYFLAETTVFVKETQKSISGSDENFELKKQAQKQFHTDLLIYCKENKSVVTDKRFIAEHLVATLRDVGAKKIYYSVFTPLSAAYRLSGFYTNRILNAYVDLDRRKTRLDKIKENLNYYLRKQSSTLVINQRQNPLSIPVVIINYNQLEYLKKLIDFLIARNFENIIIIDNASSYPPLLKYYEEVEKQVTIEKLNTNYGHRVFYENDELFEKYGKGYYILTDADVVPNENLPENFMNQMIKLIDKYYKKISKVGFALDLDSIPDEYPLKEKVINWEKQYWQKEIEKDVYFAPVDTTFALYTPNSRNRNLKEFLQAIRIGGNFTALHGGWYVNPAKLTDEQLYYIKTAKVSSSWKLDESGNHDNKGTANYYKEN